MDHQRLKQLLAAELEARQLSERESQGYESFKATQLYCPACKRAMPVREKQLLVLSDGDLVDFVCTGCGKSLGTRKG